MGEGGIGVEGVELVCAYIRMYVLHVAICIVSYYSAVHDVYVMGCRRLCENEVCLYTYKLTYARTCV